MCVCVRVVTGALQGARVSHYEGISPGSPIPLSRPPWGLDGCSRGGEAEGPGKPWLSRAARNCWGAALGVQEHASVTSDVCDGRSWVPSGAVGGAPGLSGEELGGRPGGARCA